MFKALLVLMALSGVVACGDDDGHSGNGETLAAGFTGCRAGDTVRYDDCSGRTGD
jgi:hypothetical protein